MNVCMIRRFFFLFRCSSKKVVYCLLLELLHFYQSRVHFGLGEPGSYFANFLLFLDYCATSTHAARNYISSLSLIMAK